MQKKKLKEKLKLEHLITKNIYSVCDARDFLSLKNIATGVPFKVMLHETIFSATQGCNIVTILFRTVTTLFQHCNAALR